MSARLKISLVSILALLGAGWWWQSRFFRHEVQVAKAAKGVAVDAVAGTVKVFASADAQIKTEVPGRVREIPVKSGDEVKKGDLLCALESTDVEIQLSQLRIRLKAARDRFALGHTQTRDIASLKEEIEKIRQQIAYGAASEDQLEKRQRELEKLQIWLAREQIDQQESNGLLQAQIRQLENKLERMELRAPFDGKIVEIYHFKGDWLYAGNAVCRLIAPGRAVRMTLSEEDFAGVARGQTARIRLAGASAQTLTGTVDFISPVADADKKTRDLTLKVDAEPDNLVPGVTGEAVLEKAQREETLIIPRRALIGRKVYVAAEGRVREREVKPGFISLNKAEILEGLAPGDLVILDEQGLLSPGDPVKPVFAE